MLELVDKRQDEYNETEYVVPTKGYSFRIPLQSRITISGLKKSLEALESRTYTMYPQEAAHQIPLVEGGTAGEPHCGFAVVDSTCNHVIRGRIRR